MGLDDWQIRYGVIATIKLGKSSARVNSGSSQLSVKQSINELKLGINYRFGNPLPGQYP
jgi:hypothetical protein